MSGVIQICLSVWVDMFCVCQVCGKSSVSGLCVVLLVAVSMFYIGVVLCVSIEEFVAQLALLARGWARWLVRSNRGFGLPGDCSEMSFPFL